MSTDSKYITSIKSALHKHKADEIKNHLNKLRLISPSRGKNKYYKLLLVNCFKNACSKESKKFEFIVNMSNDELTKMESLVKDFTREESEDMDYQELFMSEKYSILKILTPKNLGNKEDFIKELKNSYNEFFEMNDALVTEVTNYAGLSKETFDWKFAPRIIFEGAHTEVLYELNSGIIIPFSNEYDQSLTEILIKNEELKTQLFNQLTYCIRPDLSTGNYNKVWYQNIIATLKKNADLLFSPAPTYSVWQDLTAHADSADTDTLSLSEIKIKLNNFVNFVDYAQSEVCYFTPFPKHLEKSSMHFDAQTYHVVSSDTTTNQQEIEDQKLAYELLNVELFKPSSKAIWTNNRPFIKGCLACAGAHHPPGNHIFNLDACKYIYSATQDNQITKTPIEGITSLPMYTGQLTLFPNLAKRYLQLTSASTNFYPPAKRNARGNQSRNGNQNKNNNNNNNNNNNIKGNTTNGSSTAQVNNLNVVESTDPSPDLAFKSATNFNQ